MDVPETRYARSGELNLAYQDFGDGEPVVVIPPLISNVELSWEHELYRRVFEFMGSHVRIIQFDKRGIGGSDGFDRRPTLTERIDDITAVLDACGVERAHLVGFSEGGLMAQRFAVVRPERVDRIVLVNSLPGPPGVAHLERIGRPWDLVALASRFDELIETWGRDAGVFVDFMMPSHVDNAPFVQWLPRFQRLTASPADLRRQLDSVWHLGGVADLTTIAAPTMVIHATDDKVVPVEIGRYLAAGIPGARLLEVDSPNHFLWFDPDWRRICVEWIGFVLGRAPAGGRTRRFAAILFTDLVDSTARSAAAGDERWRELVATHDRVCDRALAAHDGRLVKRTGDGILATFATPSAAVRAADALVAELAALDLHARAGIHAGEVEVHDDGDISGLAVNIAARVEAAAGANEVLVTSTVRDLVLGGGFVLADRGEHELKGVQGRWRLHALARG